jgi:hypothetical protein
MIAALLEATLLLLLALAGGRLCADPRRRASLWFAALAVQPLVLATGVFGVGWQPWVVTQVQISADAAGAPIPVGNEPWPLYLIWGYAIGLASRALPWLRSLAWARRIVAAATSPEPTHWRDINAALARDLRRAPPRLRVHAGVPAPFLTGALRPAICIPAALEHCDPAQARHVLLHEHAHWRAYDWWRAQGVELVACLLWFHPLVHLLRRSFRRDLELACDARVLQTGADARAYADTLLQLASPDADSNAWAAPAMAASRSQLVERIACILRPPPARAPARRWPLALLAAVGLAACAINPLPRVVHQWIAPAPTPRAAVIEAPERSRSTPPVPSGRADVPEPASATTPADSREAARAAQPRASVATVAAPVRREASIAVVQAAEAREPERIPASTASLYQSLTQVAREGTPWPGGSAVAADRFETAADTRFESGMQRGRQQRDERRERNLNRVLALTGNVPFSPTFEIAPGAVRVKLGEASAEFEDDEGD